MFNSFRMETKHTRMIQNLLMRLRLATSRNAVKDKVDVGPQKIFLHSKEGRSVSDAEEGANQTWIKHNKATWLHYKDHSTGHDRIWVATPNIEFKYINLCQLLNQSMQTNQLHRLFLPWNFQRSVIPWFVVCRMPCVGKNLIIYGSLPSGNLT